MSNSKRAGPGDEFQELEEEFSLDVEPSERSDIEESKRSDIQTSERPVDQEKERDRKTLYLNPKVNKALKLASIEEDREQSEITEEALINWLEEKGYV